MLCKTNNDSLESASTGNSVLIEAPGYFEHLSKLDAPLLSANGLPILVWELAVPSDSPHLSEWARMFCQQYCLDSEIDELREGMALSRAEYLTQLVFPSDSSPPGPAVRSGDFSELLISDYVEHLLGFWVPREKYSEKANPNESVKGVDVLGFKVTNTLTPLATDTLLVFEIKANLVGKYDGQLQKAIDDSSKDFLRSAYTLNAMKRRLLRAKEKDRALVVQRFQNITDRPYVLRSGAVAVLSGKAYDAVELEKSSALGHNNAANLELIVIRGDDMMNLVHALYQRAADEA